MTIHEDYLAKVKEAERRHKSLLKELKDEWYKQMATCPHKKFTRGEQMFYALGETAPGEQCNECGMQRHCN
jgi:hypothetical protein